MRRTQFAAVLVALTLVPLVGSAESASGAPDRCPEVDSRSIEEVVRFLDDQLTETDKLKIKRYGQDEYGGALHMGLGMWIRNNLGLWWGCPLPRYFNDRGVEHADNMSGAIIDVYWRHLRGESYDTIAIIQCYSDWEKEAARLKSDAESRGEKSVPFPEFNCPERKSIYRVGSEKELRRPPG